MTWGSRGAALAAGMLAVCALVNGCAATTRGMRTPESPRDPGPFPTRAALDSLETAPPVEKLPELDIPMVEQWDLAGPFPERIGLVPADYRGGFGAELQAYARKRGGNWVVSADMACVARESGRFILARGSRPPVGLQRYMGGRCGSPGARPRVSWLLGEAPPAATEDQLLASSRARLTAMLDKVPAGRGQTTVGVWFGRSGKKVLVAVAVAEVDVDLEPLSFAPQADGTVVVSGMLPRPVERLEGLITRGRLDYAECKADPAVKLPRFSLRCAASGADPSAWVSLLVFEPGQVLGMVQADFLVFPQGKGTSSYARAALRAGPEAPEDDAERFAFLLNGLRAERGLKPVVVSGGESRLARKIAPNYFASMYGLAPQKTADLVALGLLAGWEVNQVTREAYFSDAVGTGDVSALLGEMIESPGARRTLFAPEVRAMAFGSYRFPGHDVLGALVTTYAPFEERPHDAEARMVVDALNEKRAERGLGPAELVPMTPDVRAEMDQALASGASAQEALEPVGQRALQLAHRSVSIWSLETGSLEQLQFPEAMLERPGLVVFVAVTHYRPRGLPWGVYVVGMAFAAQLGETAALSPASATSPM